MEAADFKIFVICTILSSLECFNLIIYDNLTLYLSLNSNVGRGAGGVGPLLKCGGAIIS